MTREECAQRRGNCFRRTVAAMKPEAQPRPRQDSRPDKDALGRTAPKGDGADSASPPEGFIGAPADADQVNPPTTSENAPPHRAAPALRRGVEASGDAGRVVGEPSFVTRWAGAESVEDGTHLHNLPQRVPACCPPPRPSRRGAGQADPAQPGSAASRGAKLCAAGIACRAFPWRQAQRAAPQARRREGLTPDGRDDRGGTGRSPKARRRIAPTCGQGAMSQPTAPSAKAQGYLSRRAMAT